MMVKIRNIYLKSVDISSNEYNYNISFSYSALSFFPSSIRMKLTLYFFVKYISNLFKTCIHMPVSRTFERAVSRYFTCGIFVRVGGGGVQVSLTKKALTTAVVHARIGILPLKRYRYRQRFFFWSSAYFTEAK